MITSTQEVLVYRRDADQPEAIPWGNVCAEHKDRRDWLREVERALSDGDGWEAAGGDGPGDVVRVLLSRSWRE